MNNKVDVFDELDAPETLSEEPPESDSDRAESGIDIVDSITRAALERRTDFIRYGVRSLSKAVGSHHRVRRRKPQFGGAFLAAPLRAPFYPDPSARTRTASTSHGAP